MANVNDYPVTNGDIIDSDNQVVNIVDLLGGGTPVSNQTLNKNDFPIHSSLVIGSDNKLYDLKDLLGGSIDPDDFIPNEGNTLENENFELGRDNVNFTTQRSFIVESDNGGELSVNNGVEITSTDGSTLNVGANITATADSDVVLTSGDNSSITLSDDIVFVANDTTAMTINDETISVEEDIQTTITEFENNSLVTKQYVSDNTINESIVDVASLPTGSNIKDVVYRLTTDNPETIPGETVTIAFNSATTDVDLFTPTLESTGLFNIVTNEGEMGVTYYAYPKNELYVEYVTDNEYGTNIEYSRLNSMQWSQMGGVQVDSSTGGGYLGPGEVGTFTFTQPSTIVHHYTYSYYMGDSTNQTTTELSSGSPTEPTASEIEAYEADILSVIS